MARFDFKCDTCGFIFEEDAKWAFKPCPECGNRSKKDWTTLNQTVIINGDNLASTRRNINNA